MSNIKIWDEEKQRHVVVKDQYYWVRTLYEEGKISYYLLHALNRYFDYPGLNENSDKIFDLTNIDIRRLKKIRNVGKKIVNECLEFYDKYKLNYINS